jgi:hypothetical protein
MKQAGRDPCRDMTELTSRSMDARPPFSERLPIRPHLVYCKACRRFLHQARALRDALAARPACGESLTEASGHRLSDDAAARILRQCEGRDGGLSVWKPS